MLKLKHKTHLTLPHPKLPTAMKLSPVTAEADELIEAIEADSAEKDDQWTLTERPDGDMLESFWNGVVDDVRKDPDWIAIDE